MVEFLRAARLSLLFFCWLVLASNPKGASGLRALDGATPRDFYHATGYARISLTTRAGNSSVSRSLRPSRT